VSLTADPTKISLLQAIWRQEGAVDQYGHLIPEHRAARNNNPGDIDYGKFAKAHDAIGTDGRFAIFPTLEAGMQADAALFASAYHGMTIAAALDKYAPPSENQTNVYITNVCEWTGLPPTAIISDYLSIPSLESMGVKETSCIYARGVQ